MILIPNWTVAILAIMVSSLAVAVIMTNLTRKLGFGGVRFWVVIGTICFALGCLLFGLLIVSNQTY